MYRILLTGLGLGPAFIASLPFSGVAVAVSGIGSAYALLASLRPQRIRVNKFTTGAKRGTTLLSAQLSDAQTDGLPDHREISRELQRVLSAGKEVQPPGAPPSREAVIARALMGFMLGGWKTKDIAKLTKMQRSELYLICAVLQATPGEAGRIAQLFARPETMLELRDEIDSVDLRRAAFDRDYNAYLATQDLWENSARTGKPLLAQIQSLGSPDVDLWHHIIMNHDMSNPDQRRTALWCLKQKDVDRATVAAYFGRITKARALHKALADGDVEFMIAIQGLIHAWNDSFYKQSLLALLPPYDVAMLKPTFELEIEYMQEHADRAGWVAPHCLFVEYEGRPPRNRDHWDLHIGHLTQPPRQGDYFEPAFETL